MRDAGQSHADAEESLLARAVADGLSKTEVRQTIHSAFSHTAREPLGPTPGGHDTRQPSRHGTGPPEPVDGGFLRLLETCFQPDEFVAIAPAVNDDGEVKPRRGTTLTAAQWKAKVEAKGGIEKVITTKLGLFLRINPMRKDGATNEDVVAFRHALVEFDCDKNGNPIPKADQYQTILDSFIPVTTLIDSGNKSLHAWVRVDAPDEKEYKRRVEIIWGWFSGINLDRQNRNPSRLSRCPDGWRTVNGDVRRQCLLALEFGGESWTAWKAAHSTSDLPPILPGGDFMGHPEPEPPQLVDGVLHQGAKMVLGGPSKARKSWSLIDLMLSVSTGSPWWGFTTCSGRALYLNFELPAFALQYRITRIAAAKGITDFTGFDIWNLRGHATDFSALIPKILGRIRDTGYSLILIDPIYKGLGSRNENDAGDIASLLNEVEQLTTVRQNRKSIESQRLTQGRPHPCPFCMKCHNATSHITEGLTAPADTPEIPLINEFRRHEARNYAPKKWEIEVKFPIGFPTWPDGKFPTPGLTRFPGQMAGSKLESKFLFLWRVAQGPAFEREVLFHPTRKWRADFAHLESRMLIEIEGGIFMRAGGRHTRGSGYAKDAEKYLEAALAGWTVLRLTERQLEISTIERIVGWLNR